MLLEGAKNRLARSKLASGAFRYPEYRKYWFATLASVIGFQMVMFSQLWLVRQLEANPIWLGLVGLATAVPAIILNLFGGVVADKFDQRRLIMITQTLLGSLVFLLATLTLFGVVEVWHVLAIAFCNGAVQAFDMPARMSLFPHLIDRKEIMNAVALDSSIWQGTRIIAPAITGVVIAVVGTSASLYVGSAGFLIMAVFIARLKVPQIQRAEGGSPLQNLFQGAKFVRDSSLFSSLMAMGFFNSFFGMSYIQLMPIFTIDIFQKGATAQGILLSGSGVGALLGTVNSAFLGRFPHRGWLIIGGSVLFGGLIMTFGLSHWYFISVGILFFAGYFQSIYMISLMSTLQMRVPDELRGRVMGIFGMTYNLMPMGGMFGGTVASLISAPFAVAFGGSMVSGFAVLNGAFNRQIRRLTIEPVRAAVATAPLEQQAPSGGR